MNLNENRGWKLNGSKSGDFAQRGVIELKTATTDPQTVEQY